MPAYSCLQIIGIGTIIQTAGECAKIISPHNLMTKKKKSKKSRCDAYQMIIYDLKLNMINLHSCVISYNLSRTGTHLILNVSLLK